MFLGNRIHVRAGREVLGVLLASVQHDDEAVRLVGARTLGRRADSGERLLCR